MRAFSDLWLAKFKEFTRKQLERGNEQRILKYKHPIRKCRGIILYQ